MAISIHPASRCLAETDGSLVAMSLGIRRLRIMAGLSRDELGTIAGVSGRTVENWENGRNQPTTAALMLMKNHFEEKVER